ncbi:MAG: 2-hydroxyglutaryl-CoA dehydratase [Proteobacteria bacterium]|nr:2-hydroxyglutaryl-CoA dehydratase [Pseudomonadota bacterium]
MIRVAGCDVGSLTSKAVIMEKNRIVGFSIVKSKAKPQDSADEAMQAALSQADCGLEDIKYCVGTGYGRDQISFVDEARSEIACHGMGAKWLVPSVRTIIDIGGQDCKAIRIDKNGKVEKFITNDKCASGTGRFLEVMAKVLNIGVDELGELTDKAQTPITFASMCTVWAQADVIKYINSGYSIEDIGAGINAAMAKRVAMLANAVKAEKDVCMTGGVAKNKGVVSTLEKVIGVKIKRVRKADPQIAGAIGAALFSQARLNGGGDK